MAGLNGTSRRVAGTEAVPAVVSIMEATRALVMNLPTGHASHPRVYAALQRLACDVETTLAAADHTRGRPC